MRTVLILFLALAILTVAITGAIFVNNRKTVQTDVGLTIVRLAFAFGSIDEVDSNIKKLSSVCDEEAAGYLNMRSRATRCEIYDNFRSEKSEVQVVWDTPGLVVFCIYSDGFVRTDLYCLEYNVTHKQVHNVKVYKLDNWRDGAEGGFF